MLETCNNYWVVVTSVYCGRRSDSEPQLSGFKDARSFEVSVSLQGGDVPLCNEWIATDTQQKIMDMESGLRGAELSCGFQIPCFRNSMWSCSDDDNTKASFR